MTKKFHDLVAGARSYRRFDQSKKMTMQELEEKNKTKGEDKNEQ